MASDTAIDLAPGGWRQRFPMRHANGVDDRIDLFSPEIQKPMKPWKFRGIVKCLPQIGLKDPGVIRHVVKDLSRKKARTPQPARKLLF